MKLPSIFLCFVTIVCLTIHEPAAQYGAPDGEWPAYGGDPGNTKYSALDQINKDNVNDLEIAWRWKSIVEPVLEEHSDIRVGQHKAIPIMVDGLIYVPTQVSQVAAIDAGTGETVWSYDPKAYRHGVRPANMGWQHRGVAYWSDGEDARVFIPTHDLQLIALDAKTGEPCPDFGEDGVVDLSTSLGKPVHMRNITHTSPPAVCRDTVVVGSVVSDHTLTLQGAPGHVRGFDARTGEMKWIFHTVPQEGEFGVETWKNDSWKYTGAVNVWNFMAADEALGYVYLPTSTPTNDPYGGHRLGDNLFGESLVCLDAETGERIWHFQIVHHGLWDYDLPTGPNLMDITVDGKKIKAVAQVTKQAFTFVFDRVTGEPVWPIEERPVPASTVPGEEASPTQPFPTKPKPFDLQGITKDDLIDLTPELKKEALEIAKEYRLAPVYTPPALDGEKPVIHVPADIGGANWPGAASDPEAGYLFIPSRKTARTFVVGKMDPNRSNLAYGPKHWTAGLRGPSGLPLLKPPYTRVTAIDLNSGDHAWMAPHGEGPTRHPALRGLDTGPLGQDGILAGGPMATKTLLFVTFGGRDVRRTAEGLRRLTVYDKETGDYLASLELPAPPYGNPITYMHEGKQYIVVAIGGSAGAIGGGGPPSELVALALP